MRCTRDKTELKDKVKVYFVDRDLSIVWGHIEKLDQYNDLAWVTVPDRGSFYRSFDELYGHEVNAVVECLEMIAQAQIKAARILERCLESIARQPVQS